MMNIAETFILMISDDPKKKLLAEYYQTAIRYLDVLKAPDNFPQKEKLLGVMVEYLKLLYSRCQDLNIKLTDSMDLDNIVKFIASDKSDSKENSCNGTLHSKFDRMIKLLESIDSKLSPAFGHDLRIFDPFQKPFYEPIYSPYKVTCDTTNGIKYAYHSPNEEDYRQKE